MTMNHYSTPGVYPEDIAPPPAAELPTGVPLFLGLAAQGSSDGGLPLTRWQQFVEQFGPPQADRYLAHAVHGFFANGGQLCYVLPLADRSFDALERGLAAASALTSIDLICAPDLAQPLPRGDSWAARAPEVRVKQQALLDHCARLGDRFAILDALPGASVAEVLEQRGDLSGASGGLYFPWIDVGERDAWGNVGYIPPCGHIAGVYARCDQRVGVHKAPANEVLVGVLDLEIDVGGGLQGQLNPAGVNCLRAFPGRGIRVWGARTLAGAQHPEWTYVSVRRLFLTAGRWIERNLTGAVFEPSGPALWARIERELAAYCTDLFRRGALGGRTPREAFYVRCDATTNPPDARERGEVIAEIGLAPGLPNEYVVVRIIHGASGITVSGPAPSGL